MAKTLKDKMSKLPLERRRKINRRLHDLVEEVMLLSELRKEMGFTQDELADLLSIRQEGISRIERRPDLLLSTLQNYVAAIGGKLRLVVEFPDRAPVVLQDFDGTQFAYY